MSLARRHRDRILASLSVASAPQARAALAPAAVASPAAGATSASPAARAEREIALRLTHDLRRLKEIRSIDRKVEAKREMLPEYQSWIAGIVGADAGVGTGVAADVVPTCMVWMLDVGDYAQALTIGEFLLRHKVPMPSRYARDVATVIVEIIADAAVKAQSAGSTFEASVLNTADNLTAGIDIHDEVRAKLMKAIGVEQLRKAEEMAAGDSKPVLVSALVNLREAQRLNDRVGVKDRIKRAEKLLTAVETAAALTDPGGTPAA